MLLSRKDADPDDIQSAKDEVIEGITARLMSEIIGDSVGAVQIQQDDENESGYELVEFKDSPFTLQENVGGFKSGQLVCKVVYMYPVPRARNWYTPGTEEEYVLVQHVVATQLELERPSKKIKLPRSCNSKQAQEKGARHLKSSSHSAILEEICRREELECEQDVSDNKSESDEESIDEEESDIEYFTDEEEC